MAAGRVAGGFLGFGFSPDFHEVRYRMENYVGDDAPDYRALGKTEPQGHEIQKQRPY